MTHDMSGAATALMILMMAVMGGLPAAVIARKAPAWLAHIIRTGPKPPAPAAGAHEKDPR